MNYCIKVHFKCKHLCRNYVYNTSIMNKLFKTYQTYYIRSYSNRCKRHFAYKSLRELPKMCT